MSTEYIDIHSHLNFPQYDTDRGKVIEDLEKNNISTITIGTNLKTSTEAIELAEKYSYVYASVGVHPGDDPNDRFEEPRFEKLVSHKKVVAIGECGLDYFRLPSVPSEADAEKRRQKEDFEKQISFAVKYDKPLMIHCRAAYDDALDILSSKKKEYGDKLCANFHFFTEPIETAKKILDLGFTVSFTGVITFVKQYAELVSYVPLDAMMSETDAPYVAPAPHRGMRNEPAYVIEVVKKIAEIKKMPLEEVKRQLVANAQKNFKLR